MYAPLPPQEFFRPELLNRVDATVVFRALGRPALRNIACKAVAAVAARLLEGRSIRLQVAPCLTDYLCVADQVPPFRRPLLRKLGIANGTRGRNDDRKDWLCPAPQSAPHRPMFPELPRFGRRPH